MRYEPPESSTNNSPNHPSNPFFTLALLLIVIVIGYKLISKHVYYLYILHHKPVAMHVQHFSTPEPTPVPIVITQPAEQIWIHYIVQSGDTLSKIFARLQLDPQDLTAMKQIRGKATLPRNLSKGQVVDILVSDNPEPNSPYRILREFRLKLDARKTLTIINDADHFTATIIEQQVETKIKMATVTITSSFLNSGAKAKIPDSVLRQLMTLFHWRINFANDIRKNDYFTIAYEEEYLNGKKIKTDDIVAAEFVNKGVHYYAIRYTPRAGEPDYYSSNGASIRKGFLRRPVNIGYISSPFSLARRHPILGYVRPHKGTDFAAPYGTPIHATGDGRIKFVGRDGGYGRVVMINHGSGIETLYAHMSRYANNLKVGQQVKQNQVIGYIGTSGLADGPHVHYEFHINNKPYDAMKVRLPNAAPIPRSQLKSYLAYADKEVNALYSYRINSLGANAVTPIAQTKKIK